MTPRLFSLQFSKHPPPTVKVERQEKKNTKLYLGGGGRGYICKEFWIDDYFGNGLARNLFCSLRTPLQITITSAGRFVG